MLLVAILAAAPSWNQQTADELGKRCTSRNDAKACAKLLSLSSAGCEQGIGEACFKQAALLGHSKLPGITRDEAAGERALEKACSLGQHAGCVLLASSRIMASRFDDATQLLEKSCAAGYVPACRQVAGAFKLTKDGALASDLPGLTTQCDGEPRLTGLACFELGRWRRAAGDVAGAVTALERACRHWSTEACHLLFEWYAAEDAGVPHDAKRAKAWLDEESALSRAVWAADAGLGH